MTLRLAIVTYGDRTVAVGSDEWDDEELAERARGLADPWPDDVVTVRVVEVEVEDD